MVIRRKVIATNIFEISKPALLSLHLGKLEGLNLYCDPSLTRAMGFESHLDFN